MLAARCWGPERNSLAAVLDWVPPVTLPRLQAAHRTLPRETPANLRARLPFQCQLCALHALLLHGRAERLLLRAPARRGGGQSERRAGAAWVQLPVRQRGASGHSCFFPRHRTPPDQRHR